MDTRSEYEKGADLPLCLRCAGVAIHCPCPWPYTLPVGVSPANVNAGERRRYDERAARERSYLEGLHAQDKLSTNVLARLLGRAA